VKQNGEEIDCDLGHPRVGEDVEGQVENIKTCMECTEEGCPVKGLLGHYVKLSINARYGKMVETQQTFHLGQGCEEGAFFNDEKVEMDLSSVYPEAITERVFTEEGIKAIREKIEKDGEITLNWGDSLLHIREVKE
jgi:hypothetical protein